VAPKGDNARPRGYTQRSQKKKKKGKKKEGEVQSRKIELILQVSHGRGMAKRGTCKNA